MIELSAVADRAFLPSAAAVAEGRVPGATLGVVTTDGRRALVSTGSAQIAPAREALTLGHWFDLASLTKVIATTPAILRMADEGLLDLDQPLADPIPDLRQYDVANARERRVTFRDCLTHNTHFPAVEPLYTWCDEPRRLRAFILLGIAIERITGKPLELMRLSPRPGMAARPGARRRDRAVHVARPRAEGRGA